MSFDRVPSKAEVLGWSPHLLADYMKRMDLAGCDKVILKYCMNGARFLTMTENDLHKFPKIHAPFISKICREISRKEEKRGLFGKRSTPKYHEPETPAEDQCWGPDEFDSDDDYLSPNADEDDEGSVGDYESPAEEFEAENDDYEPPPSEPPEDIPSQFGPSLPMGDSEYIDNRSRVKPPVVQPRPGPGPPNPALARPSLIEPPPPRREQSPQRPGRPPTKVLPGPPAPQVDRSKKPTAADRGLNNASPIQARRPNPIARPVTHSQSWREERGAPDLPKVAKPPLPSLSVNRSSSSVGRAAVPNRLVPNARTEVQEEGAAPRRFSSHTFPLNTRGPQHPMAPRPSGPPPLSDSLPPSLSSTCSLPHKLHEAISSHRSSARIVPERLSVSPRPPIQPSYPPQPDRDDQQDMDTRWYVGQVTRGKAEGCLRQVNKDGAFLVRDSSRGSLQQPYTLMVLYQEKVFNIQIKRLKDQYLLGTGLKASETFPSVSDIISHYQQMPLLLIDAKNRGSGQQNQCPLLYPAGF